MYRGENKWVIAIGAYILHVLHEVACKNPWHSHHKAQAQTQGLSTIATRTMFTFMILCTPISITTITVTE